MKQIEKLTKKSTKNIMKKETILTDRILTQQYSQWHSQESFMMLDMALLVIYSIRKWLINWMEKNGSIK